MHQLVSHTIDEGVAAGQKEHSGDGVANEVGDHGGADVLHSNPSRMRHVLALSADKAVCKELGSWQVSVAHGRVTAKPSL